MYLAPTEKELEETKIKKKKTVNKWFYSATATYAAAVRMAHGKV